MKKIILILVALLMISCEVDCGDDTDNESAIIENHNLIKYTIKGAGGRAINIYKITVEECDYLIDYNEDFIYHMPTCENTIHGENTEKKPISILDEYRNRDK